MLWGLGIIRVYPTKHLNMPQNIVVILRLLFVLGMTALIVGGSVSVGSGDSYIHIEGPKMRKGR